MAEKDPLDKLEEQLKCAVCLDTYTDPKVLLCNHAYCKACIDLLARNSRSIACPNCRKVTPIPENGVKALQPAFWINDLFEIKESLEKRTKGVTAGIAVSHCNEHGDEEVKLYCETCEKLICYQCVIKGAKHHKCEYGMLTELSDKYKREIMASLEPVKKNLNTIDIAMERLQACRDDIADHCVAIGVSIEDEIQQLHDALDTRKARLMNQLQEVTHRKMEIVDTQTDRIKAMHTHLEQCQASVENRLKTDNKEEILGVKNVLIRQIEEANSSFKPDILEPKAEADIKFTSSTGTTEICLDHGSLNSSELFPDPTQCYATGPGLEAAEVGKAASVVVNGVNFLGQPCEVQMLQCELVSEITGTTEAISNTCLNDKHLEVRYTPKVKGRNQLSIKISNQHIKGSPFTVPVKSANMYGHHACKHISSISVPHPWGVVVNHRNEIIVSEKKNHCVSIFHPSGKKLRSFGTQGSGGGQFNSPMGVTLDNEDNILVADSKNSSIQKFSADGTFLAAFRSISRPTDIAFSSINGRLYVVNGNVYVLSLDFRILTVRGPKGKTAKYEGVECDKHGRVYLAVSGYKHRIDICSADSSFLNSFRGLGFACIPHSIAIDSHSALFVSDCNCSVISIFTLEGEPLGSFRGVLNGPHGIAFDDCDVFYVCDTGNNRICIF